MPTNIVIPEMGESVTQGVIAAWRKSDGDYVKRDETVLELETDKITAEIPAPASGVLRQGKKVGDTVPVGAVVGSVDESAAAPAGKTPPAKPPPESAKPAAARPPAPEPKPATTNGKAGAPGAQPAGDDVRATPLARKLADEHRVDLHGLAGTGAGGRIREQDVMAAVQSRPGGPATATASASPAGATAARRERLSPLRQRIAARLVEAQHTAAMLTTFNECDMSAVLSLRKQYKEDFERKHGVGLGFMSFFAKAVVGALKAFPLVNASLVSGVSGEAGGVEIEFHDSCDIAFAVSTPKGLTVPVLRGCDRLSFAQIESGIKDLATRARDGKLALADLQGGTFTITNGGVFGSLLSTPILNPPQSAILGMHTIKPRPIEHPPGSGQVAVRPMMYLALSYDHRLVDGAEAVQFLVSVKGAIEDPQRLLLGV